MSLSRLTIIIPTYKRQEYVLRNMGYWSGLGPIVHVFDGSKQPIENKLLLDFEENVHYHHYPIGLIERLNKSVDFVNTDYVALLCDDEFYVPSALLKCINCLDSEPDMVSTGGRTIFFSYLDNNVYGVVGYPGHRDYKVLSNDSCERMVYHMSPYYQTIMYSVIRSNIWKKAISIVTQKEYPVYALPEIQVELAVCYQGKSKVLPYLMLMRSKENFQINEGAICLNPDKRIWDWWQRSDTLLECNEFIDIMSRGLGGSEDEILSARKSVSKAIETYINDFYDQGGFIKRIVSNMKSLIPQCIKKYIRKLMFLNYTVQDYKGSGISLIDAGKALANTGVMVNFDELSRIEKIVNDFHKTIDQQS